MIQRTLPPVDEMYSAFLGRDTRYDGIFVTGVKTTGIFCRPSCGARKPAIANVEFFPSAREAMASGYRPCRRCTPLEVPGRTPDPIRQLVSELASDPTVRVRDADLRDRGLDPATVRRWFKRNHGMTFHDYQRSLRVGRALGRLGAGEPITRVAFGIGYESLSGFNDALRQLTGQPAGRSRGAVAVYLQRVETPIGPMLLGATDTEVCLLEFTDRRMLETQLRRLSQRLGCTFVPGLNQVGERLSAELESYFEGRSHRFETPLLTPGSEFQQRVWHALKEIPPGETRSYAEQARLIGEPRAVRAVARANGDNRVAIVIPCHRVIGADGGLTGYGGGLWRKRWLLHHEREAFGAAPSGTPHGQEHSGLT